MEETIEVTGVVSMSAPAGEYDRRLVIITRELGKITVFASGARRPTCPYLAACRTFTFASFTLLVTRAFYRLKEAHIVESFEGLARDFDAMSYGNYFLELACHFSEENVEAGDVVNLIYVSLKALLRPALPKKLVRLVFELRMLVINGEAPQVFTCINCNKQITEGFFVVRRHGMICPECQKDGGPYLCAGAVAALQFAQTAPVSKLFSFSVTDEILKSLTEVMEQYYERYVGRKFKSLELLL